MSDLMLEGFESYYRDATRFLELYEGPLDSVVDLGAHVGSVSLLAAKRGAEKVVAYEPHPMTFQILKDMIKEHNFGKIISAKNEAVVGNMDKERILYAPGIVSDPTSCLINRWAGNAVRNKVQCVRFKDILKKGVIDYLKIDIEGMEYELFDSVIEKNLSCVRFLDLEVHHTPHCDEEAFHKKIKALGFVKDVFPQVMEDHGINAIGRFNENFKGKNYESPKADPSSPADVKQGGE